MAADIIDLKDRMKNTADKKTVAEKVQDLKEAPGQSPGSASA